MRKEYQILLLAGLLANFGDNLIGPFYAVFVENIGGSILDIGYSVVTYSIAAGVLIILIGKLSDKIDKRIITILGYLLFAFGSLGYLMISEPIQLFGLQIIFALATACLSAPLSALYARYIAEESAGLQWGLSSGGTYIVVGFAVLAGTFIVSQWGFTYLFLIMFSIQIFAAAVQTQLYLCAEQEI